MDLDLLLTGKWFLDGHDIWKTFSLIIYDGATTFLELPEVKPKIERDWQNANGLSVNLNRVFYKSREITLSCYLLEYSEAEFIKKRDLLLTQLSKPGERRLSFTSMGQRSFYVDYLNSTGWNHIEPLSGVSHSREVMYEFNIIVRELNPAKGMIEDNFLVTEDGRYIIS